MVSFVFSLYSFVKVLLSLDNVQPVTSCISSFALIVTITLSLVISFVLYSIVTSGAVSSISPFSILLISIVTCVSFPAKSFTVMVSFVFSLYSFVNVLLSLDNVQSSTSCISSFAVIVTVTLSFVISFVLYSIVTSGAVSSISSFSILLISIVTCVSFPAKSFTIMVSLVLLLYSFVNVLLSFDNVQPSTSCISSFA